MLDGPRKHGEKKTCYARQLAGKGEYIFETDCSDKDYPEISCLCSAKHQIALFDECSAAVVLLSKKLMQGNMELG